MTAVNDESGIADADTDVVPDRAGGSAVLLRADKSKGRDFRSYTINATATDAVGNVTTATASCVVPHDQGNRK